MAADLLDGLARHLAQRGHGSYDPTGGVQAADWSIFLRRVPQQPARMISINRYAGPPSDAGLPLDTVGVQVRVRGREDPSVSEDRAQAIYDELHGLGYLALPGDGVWVQLCEGSQAGPVPLGPDGEGRFEYTVNFLVTITNPSAHRPL